MSLHKVRVGILFGGRTPEHEVSLLSAKRVVGHLDRKKYAMTLIGIDKEGKWRIYNEGPYVQDEGSPKTIKLLPAKRQLPLLSHEGKGILDAPSVLDVIFPLLHGPDGEDGAIQGLLRMANLPFVGPSILGSAIGMDKDVAKRLLRDAGLPVVPFRTLHAHQELPFFAALREEFGLPLFVKPANLGSSIGISKVQNEADFQPAIAHAFAYDRKILIEKGIVGREFQCGVIGNAKKWASLPGEVLFSGEFHTYETKYISGAQSIIPAPVPADVSATIQEMAIRTCEVLCCDGMARVDFLCDAKGTLFVNEINTIPGCTPTSPFPALWEASGLPFSALLDRLIALALERHHATTP